jgi:hypothetical protein
MVEIRNVCNILVEKLKSKDIGRDRRPVVQWILKECASGGGLDLSA